MTTGSAWPAPDSDLGVKFVTFLDFVGPSAVGTLATEFRVDPDDVRATLAMLTRDGYLEREALGHYRSTRAWRPEGITA